MRLLNQNDFDTLWPVHIAAVQVQATGILNTQATVFPRYGINSSLVLAHMMAQFSEECGGGTEMVESLNYSTQALLDTWPKHFSQAEAEQYGRNAQHPADQRMIGNLAYGTRMGNHPGTDDGYNFRGRGLIQTTGRDGYDELGQSLGINLVDNPDNLINPIHALAYSVDEFVHYQYNGKSMLDYCLDDNVAAVSSLINLGIVTYNTSHIEGYSERVKWLARWKTELDI